MITARQYHTIKQDRLKGGRADRMPDSAFNRKAIRRGMRVEREHAKSPALAKEIAKDHLVEDKQYYRKLAKMEKGMKAKRNTPTPTPYKHDPKKVDIARDSTVNVKHRSQAGKTWSLDKRARRSIRISQVLDKLKKRKGKNWKRRTERVRAYAGKLWKDGPTKPVHKAGKHRYFSARSRELPNRMRRIVDRIEERHNKKGWGKEDEHTERQWKKAQEAYSKLMDKKPMHLGQQRNYDDGKFVALNCHAKRRPPTEHKIEQHKKEHRVLKQRDEMEALGASEDKKNRQRMLLSQASRMAH